jgi:hypothetical protein
VQTERFHLDARLSHNERQAAMARHASLVAEAERLAATILARRALAGDDEHWTLVEIKGENASESARGGLFRLSDRKADPLRVDLGKWAPMEWDSDNWDSLHSLATTEVDRFVAHLQRLVDAGSSPV